MSHNEQADVSAFPGGEPTASEAAMDLLLSAARMGRAMQPEHARVLRRMAAETLNGQGFSMDRVEQLAQAAYPLAAVDREIANRV